MKITNKDTHTLCPVGGLTIKGLTTGSKLRYNGQVYTVKGCTAYMAWFQEKTFKVVGASKANPVEIEVELIDESAEAEAA